MSCGVQLAQVRASVLPLNKHRGTLGEALNSLDLGFLNCNMGDIAAPVSHVWSRGCNEASPAQCPRIR